MNQKRDHACTRTRSSLWWSLRGHLCRITQGKACKHGILSTSSSIYLGNLLLLPSIFSPRSEPTRGEVRRAASSPHFNLKRKSKTRNQVTTMKLTSHETIMRMLGIHLTEISDNHDVLKNRRIKVSAGATMLKHGGHQQLQRF